MKTIHIMVLLIAVMILTGCANNNNNNNNDNGVKLKLKWVHQAQFAGNYVAKEKGFYDDEGLNVEIEEFTFENPTIPAVLNGDAMFGITGADELAIARAEGKPLKAFAVIYRINPVCAYALKESGIVKPEDFTGKTVGIEKGINVEYIYSAMMSKLGIDRTKITEVEIGYDATELLAGTTDVSTGYIINEPHQAIEAGKEVNTILMADYGVNMYADVLFATEDTINNRPDTVKSFLKATLKGWEYSIENEDESVDIVLKYANDRTKSHEMYMLESSIPLINTGKIKIGLMEDSEWENVVDVLVEQNMLSDRIDHKTLYTNAFFEMN